MLDIALSELKRHKVRTFLTGLGIVIAIAAIVSLGSISAGMGVLIEGTMRQLGADKIMVMKAGSGIGGGGTGSGFGGTAFETLDETLADEIMQISGVDDALPVIRTSYMGVIPLIGADEKHREFMQLTDIKFTEGSWYDDSDTDVVVLGKDLAEAKGLSVGDSVKIKNRDLTVVGIIEGGEIRGANLMMIMPYKEAQDVLGMEGEATVIIVKPTEMAMADSIKDQIKEEFDDLQALTTEDLLKRAESVIGTVRVITLGIGFIASLVAALGIIITMITSISERKRQIGIMKAVGARGRHIMAQILEESIMISLLSGAFGLLIGYGMVGVLNQAMMGGMNIAEVTPALAAGAVAYGVILSLVSSLYPAWKASKIDPMEAIRS